MANTIKIKRGLSSNISNVTLEPGELAITTDTNELYAGTESGNIKLNNSGLKNLVEYDSVVSQLSNMDNNNEFRFFGPYNSGVTNLELSFENISLTSTDEFEIAAIFQTSSSGCTFNIIETDSIKVKLTGDDVTNGTLTPLENKVYEIAFYWNGLFMSGLVRGVEHDAAVDIRNKITIANRIKGDNDIKLYVFSDEGCTNIIGTIAETESQEFKLDSNLIYAGYEKASTQSMSINTSLHSGCTSTQIDNSTYKAYKIEITSSPASITLSGK